MCSGDRNGIISPYFFESIRNTQTGALIEFVRPPASLHEDMLCPVIEDDLDLPPPWGATGFEPSVVTEDKSIHIVGKGGIYKTREHCYKLSFKGFITRRIHHLLRKI